MKIYNCLKMFSTRTRNTNQLSQPGWLELIDIWAEQSWFHQSSSFPPAMSGKSQHSSYLILTVNSLQIRTCPEFRPNPYSSFTPSGNVQIKRKLKTMKLCVVGLWSLWSHPPKWINGNNVITQVDGSIALAVDIIIYIFPNI